MKSFFLSIFVALLIVWLNKYGRQTMQDGSSMSHRLSKIEQTVSIYAYTTSWDQCGAISFSHSSLICVVPLMYILVVWSRSV